MNPLERVLGVTLDMKPVSDTVGDVVADMSENIEVQMVGHEPGEYFPFRISWLKESLAWRCLKWMGYGHILFLLKIVSKFVGKSSGSKSCNRYWIFVLK